MGQRFLWATVLLLLVNLIAAQPALPADNSSALQAPAISGTPSAPTFDSPGLLPPEIPDDNLPTLTLQLVRADTQQPLANALATLVLREPDTNTTKVAARYSNAEGKVSCQNAPGKVSVQARVNDPQTPGTDYISSEHEIDLVASRAQSILLWPAGSVLATVRDADGDLVSGAQLTLSCASDAPNSQLPATTDATGAARFDYAPAGECQLAATHENHAARASITVTQGQVASANLALSEKLNADNPLVLIALVALAVILLGGIAFFIVLKPQRENASRTATPPAFPAKTQKPATARAVPAILLKPNKTTAARPAKTAVKPKKTASGKQPKKTMARTNAARSERRATPARTTRPARPAAQAARSARLTPRQQDLLKTLDEREASVARLLFENGGKLRANKIRYALMIPKTSFFRIAQNLERRRIAKTLKHENFATLALTSWFLTGKDDGEAR